MATIEIPLSEYGDGDTLIVRCPPAMLGKPEQRENVRRSLEEGLRRKLLVIPSDVEVSVLRKVNGPEIGV